MSEKLSSVEKVPTPILLIFVVISPFLSNILLASDLELVLGVCGLIIFGVALILTIVLYFWTEEKRRDRILKEREMTNQLTEKKIEQELKRYEIDHSRNLQQTQAFASIFGNMFKDILGKMIEDPEYYKKIQDLSKQQDTKK